jgi:hypothetical protein
MQILYALPFLALSVIASVVCLVIPGLRRHLITAAVAPAAFGFWSMASLGEALFIADAVGLFAALDANFSAAIAFFYFLPGVIGAWLSVWLAHGILRRRFT